MFPPISLFFFLLQSLRIFSIFVVFDQIFPLGGWEAVSEDRFTVKGDGIPGNSGLLYFVPGKPSNHR